jgi:hypothetical protein
VIAVTFLSASLSTFSGAINSYDSNTTVVLNRSLAQANPDSPELQKPAQANLQ